MAKLKPDARNALPATTFGLPAQRKYPMPDASHAVNAKARATQQVAAGNLAPAQKASIDRKADGILHKGKTFSHAPIKHAKRGGGAMGGY